MEEIKLNDQITNGPQPSADQIRELGNGGFKSVVNLRTEGENDQPLSPQDEGEQVRAAGMQYVHLPVSLKSMRPKAVDEFRKLYAELPKPLFAHCKSGKRSGAIVMMNLAVEQGMSGDEALRRADEMGFECDKPELRQFVRDYVDDRRSVE